MEIEGLGKAVRTAFELAVFPNKHRQDIGVLEEALDRFLETKYPKVLEHAEKYRHDWRFSFTHANYLLALEKEGLLPKEVKPFAELARAEGELFLFAHVLHRLPGRDDVPSWRTVFKRPLDKATTQAVMENLKKFDYDPNHGPDKRRMIPSRLPREANLFEQYQTMEDVLKFMQKNVDPDGLEKEIERMREYVNQLQESGTGVFKDVGHNLESDIKLTQLVAQRISQNKLVPKRPKSFQQCLRLLSTPQKKKQPKQEKKKNKKQKKRRRGR